MQSLDNPKINTLKANGNNFTDLGVS
jgi:hypothetical protein